MKIDFAFPKAKLFTGCRPISAVISHLKQKLFSIEDDFQQKPSSIENNSKRYHYQIITWSVIRDTSSACPIPTGRTHRCSFRNG